MKKKEYYPYKAKSLTYNQNITYYTPQNDKFINYT